MGLISGLVKTIGDWFSGGASATNQENSIAKTKAPDSQKEFSPKTKPVVNERPGSVKDSPLEILEKLKSNPKRYEASLQQLGPRAALIRETLNDPTRFAKMQELLRTNQNGIKSIFSQNNFELDTKKLLNYGIKVISDSGSNSPIRVIKLKLRNGITILLSPDSHTNSCHVRTVYDIGAKDDTIPGIAHLFEHLSVGRCKYPSFDKGEDSSIVKYHGGITNAYTGKDQTAYWSTLPAECLELGLKIESERVKAADLESVRDDLDTEKSVIEQEIKLGRDNLRRRLFDSMNKLIYNGTPDATNVIGTLESLKQITIADLKSFYGKYSEQLQKIKLVLTGNLGDPENLSRLLIKYFGSIEERPGITTQTLVKQNLEKKTTSNTKVVSEEIDGDQSAISLAFKVPGLSHDDHLILSILADALDSGPNAVFRKTINQNEKIDVEMNAEVGSISREESLLQIMGFTDRIVNLKVLKEKIISVLEQIVREGIDPDLLDTIKKSELYQEIDLQEDNEHRAGDIIDYDTYASFEQLTARSKRIQTITNEDIKRVAAKYLKTEPYIVYLDANGKPKEIPDTASQNFDASTTNINVERMKMITNSTCPEANIPNLPKLNLKFLTNSNHKIYFNEDHRIPSMSMSMRFASKEHFSLKDRILFDILTNTWACSGTATLNKEQLHDLAEEIGGGVFMLRSSQDSMAFVVKCKTLGDNLKKVATLFRELILNTKLDIESFTKIKESLKQAVKNENKTPGAIINTQIFTNLFPKEHALHQISREEKWQLLDSISYQDLCNFWERVKKFDFDIGASGDINQEQIQKYFTSTLEDWKNSSKEIDLKLNTAHADDVQILNDDEGFKADQEQAHIAFAARFNDKLSETHPDYYKIVLANKILGGDPIISRLGAIIRENKGLVYSLGSFEQLETHTSGPFAVVASTKRANATKLAAEIRKILKSFPDDITDDEVAMAKNSLIKGFYHKSFSDNSSKAGLLVNMANRKDDSNFIENFNSKIRAYTKAEIIAAIKEHLDLNNLVEVIVDDKLRVNGKEVDTKFNAKDYKEQNGHINKIVA